MTNQWQEITAKNKKKMLLLAKQVSRKAGLKVIKRSPVDTGRFKENWNAALNAPDLSTDRVEGAGLRPVVNSMKLGDTFFFTNNLPYALRLEFGWSEQAPMGMVRLTIAEFQHMVEQEIKFIAREG